MLPKCFMVLADQVQTDTQRNYSNPLACVPSINDCVISPPKYMYILAAYLSVLPLLLMTCCRSFGLLKEKHL